MCVGPAQKGHEPSVGPSARGSKSTEGRKAAVWVYGVWSGGLYMWIWCLNLGILFWGLNLLRKPGLGSVFIMVVYSGVSIYLVGQVYDLHSFRGSGVCIKAFWGSVFI